MKRAFVISALVLQVAALAGVSHAQSSSAEPEYLRVPHRFQIFLEGGGSIPTTPAVFKDMWNPAFELTLGAGASIFPWFEVTGGAVFMSYSLNSLAAKSAIPYSGFEEVQGGAISTRQLYGSARFIGVPRARTNPFVEVAVGYFSTSAEDVEIEGYLTNSMESVSGLSVAPSVGLQYALGDYWSAYVRYTYMLNQSDGFAPGNLIQPQGGGREVDSGNQVIQNIGVGIMARF
jgi:hypothetical protein